ncbi:hypothetical protein UPYG_G00042020 [Umbra pygmaea]|uniref:Ig-like domain-containing protein n=1 Tax=Umbra pygmaea TaxID=75934 RepID=A0ABD0XQ95_UMBPY
MWTLNLILFYICFIFNAQGDLETEVKIVTRIGETLTLNTGLIEQQNLIMRWSYGPVSADKIIAKVNSGVILYEQNNRLHLDTHSGSLTITNLTTKDSGHYKLHIFNGQIKAKDFYLTVYAPVSAPYIRQRKQSRSVASPFVKESCSLVCTVKNWNDTSLFTYRREERLNQTSSPDLTTNLSLPLELLSQDNDIYTCVAANPVSNQTTKLRIKEHCQNNAGQWCGLPWMMMCLAILLHWTLFSWVPS